MAKNLVIVESPAKIKSIKKFLGTNYEVVASNGHIRDLPKSQLGIDVEHDFEPKYITIRGKGDIVAALRKQAKKAEKIYLATDPDREGEAISWHLMAALKLEPEKVKRITFNEITKTAVKASLKLPREIDMDLVDAQQARRALDRIVGYGISPLLWSKVKRGLSAGRVQSVALKIICDREKEIEAFIPEEYWTLDAILSVAGEKKPLTVHFYGREKEKIEITGEAALAEILADLETASYKVSGVKKSERKKKPPVPFITSTLQQEASKVLNFSTQKTMRLAQQLYEGVEIPGRGTSGLITYLRTDSIRVSDEAESAVRSYISEEYGQEYLTEAAVTKENGKKIQDAHEAIRPTDVTLTPVMVKDVLPRDLFRLYQLIWKRFVASRMAAARSVVTTVKVSAGGYLFTAADTETVFDGFKMVYVETDEEKEEKNGLLHKITEDSELSLTEYEKKQHFTQAPPHFTEAALVRAMEEQGIGRPSTYSPTISTIIARHYVAKEAKNLYVTELGEAVNTIMETAFPAIVDTDFTATMETLLDKVEEGDIKWKTVVKNFYPDFREALDNAEASLEKVEIAEEESDVICENCGRRMVIKYGPHGKFLACPGFPECRNTMPYYEKTGAVCPKCGGDVVVKKTRKGRRYFGCINSPECDFMSWQKPGTEKEKAEET